MTPEPPAATERPNAIIYLRVSTKDQAQRGGEAEGFSIPAQRDACLRQAETLGVSITEEFVDRGESAKSADRPELQRMLAYIREHNIKYVIVHKVDRLARNRVDDVAINVALKAAGATLVSCSENIDETPSGMLLHGIMSSIAEFYSQNLANESRKGMRQKAKTGGTPGAAPFGYLNSREWTAEGREMRTISSDAERAPIVQWMYEAYGTGEWTTAQIRDELFGRGITTARKPARPGRPLATSHVNTILKNRYYVGVVTFEGVEHAGRHEPLISETLWQHVQSVREARYQSGDKPRQRPHYLKGTIFCGRCNDIMSIEVVRNSQGILYPYFYCLGRQHRKNGCDQRAVMVQVVENAVEEHWRSETLPTAMCEEIRRLVWDHVSKVLTERDRGADAAVKRLAQLQTESEKLLQAHYADAISIDMLKREQTRIALGRAAAQQTVTASQVSRDRVRTNLDMAISLLANAYGLYLESDGMGRRMFNQAMFTQIFIDDDKVVRVERTPTFGRLLAADLPGELVAEEAHEQLVHARAVILSTGPDGAPTSTAVQTDTLPSWLHAEELEPAQGSDLREREGTEGRLPSWKSKNHGPLEDRGSNDCLLVAGVGFEPTTSGL